MFQSIYTVFEAMAAVPVICETPWLLDRPTYSSDRVPRWPERRSYIAARKAARKARRAKL